MIIDTHAHVVPGSLIETLRSERRLFPSVRLLAEAGSARMAFAGETPARPIAPRLPAPRTTPLATVPLQDGALAARVLEEALDNGFKGAMIGIQPKGVGGNLDVRPGPC